MNTQEENFMMQVEQETKKKKWFHFVLKKFIEVFERRLKRANDKSDNKISISVISEPD